MVYVNKRTGASFESDAICSGGDWEAVTPPVETVLEQPEEQPEEQPKKGTRKKA